MLVLLVYSLVMEDLNSDVAEKSIFQETSKFRRTMPGSCARMSLVLLIFGLSNLGYKERF